MAVGTWDLIKIILGSGLSSAALNQLYAWWSARRESDRSARYAALQAAVALEGYALICSRLALQTEDANKENNRGIEPVLSLPPPPSFEPTDDFRLLPPSLSAAVLGFGNVVSAKAEGIGPDVILSDDDSDADYDQPGSASHMAAAISALGYVGFEAWTLANRLRTDLHLPPLSIGGGMHFVTHLRRIHQRRVITDDEQQRAMTKLSPPEGSGS